MGAGQIYTEHWLVEHSQRVQRFENSTLYEDHLRANHSALYNSTFNMSSRTFRSQRFSRGYVGALLLASCSASWFSIFVTLTLFKKKVSLVSRNNNNLLRLFPFSVYTFPNIKIIAFQIQMRSLFRISFPSFGRQSNTKSKSLHLKRAEILFRTEHFLKQITNLTGHWMLIVGVLSGLLCPVLAMYLLVLCGIAPGPQIWDSSQVYFTGMLVTIEAIVRLPLDKYLLTLDSRTVHSPRLIVGRGQWTVHRDAILIGIKVHSPRTVHSATFS
jgi:hypothetical protein